MARNMNFDKIIQYAIAGTAVFVAVNLGRQGKFGKDVQEALAALWDGLSLSNGTGKAVGGANGSGSTGGAGGAGGGTSTKSCPFIAGYRFVTDMGDGTYAIFWNGKTVPGRFNSKVGAEQSYNQLCEYYGPDGQLP